MTCMWKKVMWSLWWTKQRCTQKFCCSLYHFHSNTMNCQSLHTKTETSKGLDLSYIIFSCFIYVLLTSFDFQVSRAMAIRALMTRRTIMTLLMLSWNLLNLQVENLILQEIAACWSQSGQCRHLPGRCQLGQSHQPLWTGVFVYVCMCKWALSSFMKELVSWFLSMHTCIVVCTCTCACFCPRLLQLRVSFLHDLAS